MKLPKARTENILEQNLENETLIYDLTIDKAFNLNETLSVVYKACGQNLTFDELKRKHKFTDDFIFLALDELKRNKLLVGEYVSPFVNTSRREAIKKVGLATMFALPLMTGLVAPQASRAASGQPDSPVFVNDLGESCNNFNGGRKANGDFCHAGVCTLTYSSSEACCSPANGRAITAGQTVTTSGDSDSSNPLYNVYPPDSPPPTCADNFRCCDTNQTPYGTCSLSNQQPITSGPYEGYTFASLECTCSC